MTADDAVTSALEALAAALDALGAPAMIIGGLAVIVRGCREQRSTSTRPCGVKGLTSGTPVDVSLARLPFEELALARATRLDLGGPRLPVVSVEDLIIQPRDREDVERLLALHAAEIDVERVRSLVAEFATLLDDPGRAVDFDRLLARAGGG